jgi:hypothetical protein
MQDLTQGFRILLLHGNQNLLFLQAEVNLIDQKLLEQLQVGWN